MIRTFNRFRRRNPVTVLLYCTVLVVFVIVLRQFRILEKSGTHTLDIHRRSDNLVEARDDDGASPVIHVVFLKIHKAGGTTMMNIFMRYGISHNLSIMVPRSHNTFSQSGILRPSQILPYSKTGLYDILCCHVIYRKSAIAPYFPSDTRYIGIVRNPFQQFLSAFIYYRYVYSVTYLKNIPGENPIRTYLQNPKLFEPRNAYFSFTNNRMAIDFGYPAKQFHSESNMRQYVDKLASELDLVLIVEYFEESLLMLKRLFRWSLHDILYIPCKYGKRKVTFNFTTDDVTRHKQYANLDYILYQRFLDIFLIKLNKQDKSFYDELQSLKSTRADVENFCENTNAEQMEVQKTRWNGQLIVTRQDCTYMSMEAIPLIDLVRSRYQ